MTMPAARHSFHRTLSSRQLLNLGSERCEFIYVRHVSGGISTIQSKSFDAGRRPFRGSEVHVIWADEECPKDIAEERQCVP